MKSLFFLAFILIAGSVIQAQYYEISFTGSGLSNSIDSIRVENLSQGTILSLEADDILLLYGTLEVNTLSGNEKAMNIYPNPMVHSTFVEFDILKTQVVCFEIFNELGALIAQQNKLVQQGRQRFEISGLNAGIYTIKVRSNNRHFTSRLISLGNGSGNIGTNYQNLGTKSLPDNSFKSTKDLIMMQYNDGEYILFKGYSGNFTTVVTLLPTQSQIVDFEFVECLDEDENNYAVVFIGNQTWMAENLKSTKFSDGTDIQHIIDDTQWSNMSTPAYCWYNNDLVIYGNTYGGLYNWYAVETGILCPAGWHVPSHDEWTQLTDYLGQMGIAGGKLKETGITHWNSPNEGANNKSGFTALPGGDRYIDGLFGLINETGFWWSSTEISPETVWGRYLTFENISAFSGYGYKPTGLSVRCLKN